MTFSEAVYDYALAGQSARHAAWPSDGPLPRTMQRLTASVTPVNESLIVERSTEPASGVILQYVEQTARWLSCVAAARCQRLLALVQSIDNFGRTPVYLEVEIMRRRPWLRL